MDLRQYYEKLHSVQKSINEDFVVLISRETSEGGKAGVLTEVPRALAARLVSEGRADLATVSQAAAYRGANAKAKQVADALLEASKMRVMVVPNEKSRSRRRKGKR